MFGAPAIDAAHMTSMTTYDENQHPRETTGQFASKGNTTPELTLVTEVPCTEECGRAAEYRYANVPRGYRAPGVESAFCGTCAAKIAADGGTIEELPQPVQPGETVVWLIEGDDHEFELVEAASEDEAIELAGEAFEARYDEDEDGDSVDVRDFLVVAGTFRGDIGGYSDEFEFAPYGDIHENTAYQKLEQAI